MTPPIKAKAVGITSAGRLFVTEADRPRIDALAEWLGDGLQIHLRGFDSLMRLQNVLRGRTPVEGSKGEGVVPGCQADQEIAGHAGMR